MSTKVKPPYLVPPVSSLVVPPDGLTVVSTFSGCGGSCLGFKMAGFRHVLACEFVEEARKTYAANFPGVPIFPGDVRDLTPEKVFELTGLKRGELDVFEGSPPCSAFSTAGKREKGWGKEKKYSDDKVQKIEDLFFEYVRLVDGLQPKCFIAENVSGMVKGTAKGYFLDILERLKKCGYDVRAQLLDAQWLGVPQARQRVIFFGVRNDLGVRPDFPKPLPYRYSVRDALPWLRSAVHDTKGQPQYSAGEIIDRPAPTITTSPGTLTCVEKREAPRVVHDTSGAWGKGEVTDLPCPTITVGVNSLNSLHFQVYGPTRKQVEGHDPAEPTDEEVKAADITRFAIGKEWDKTEVGSASEKFFSLVKPDPEKPCPTITQTAGGLGAAGVCHPYERRKFTIGEVKRLCGFPDDFKLTGTFQQQWERLGRAVPPIMMWHVAKTVKEVLERAAAKEKA